jgi:hypothetical protein
MKFNLIRPILFIAVVLLVDFYVFQAVKVITASANLTTRRVIHTIYWAITVLTVGAILYGTFVSYASWPKALRIYFTGTLAVIFLSKLLVVIFLIIDDFVRLIRWGISKISKPEPGEEYSGISRSDFLVKAGLIIAGIPMVSLIYGMVEGAFDYKVRKVKLSFNNLPPAFKGYKIVQVSDIHSGSFVSTEPLERSIKLINDQKPDLVLFTGDMVNNQSSEVLPFFDVLKQIQAPHGVYATLGNHDYGDYMSWPNEEAKAANMQQLYDFYKRLGWPLLRNQHVLLERNGEQVALAGVENWSSFSRFPKYGDLDAALHGVPEGMFTVLMSHDPTHWDAKVLEHPHPIGLTLSGHTHGMQFGIETPVFRWSPSQYIFKEWAGLYKKKDQYLYVNRGLGFLGYPGRVGIRPEITVIELG